MLEFSAEKQKRAMTDLPISKQECQQDVLQRIHDWLDMLEKRITSLSTVHKFEALKPGECELAIDRHIALMVRLFQVRQQYAKGAQEEDAQRSLDSVLQDNGKDLL